MAIMLKMAKFRNIKILAKIDIGYHDFRTILVWHSCNHALLFQGVSKFGRVRERQIACNESQMRSKER